MGSVESPAAPTEILIDPAAAELIEARHRPLESRGIDAAQLRERRERIRPLQVAAVEPGLRDLSGLAVPQG